MTSLNPPLLRAIIARETAEKVITKVVVQADIKVWARLGWHFVCYDPDDEDRLIKWCDLQQKKAI